MCTVHFKWASGPPHFFIPCNLRGLVHLSGACLACLEFSCLSRVRFSDLDQPPRREKERRDERAIRKEGNSTHQKRNQPYPRRRKEGKRKERQGKGKGKKEIRKGRDRSEHYHHPRGRTKEEKTKERGKNERRRHNNNRTVTNHPPREERKR